MLVNLFVFADQSSDLSWPVKDLQRLVCAAITVDYESRTRR